MTCVCGDSDDSFRAVGNILAHTFIFTVTRETKQNNLIHALMMGVRKVNLDIRFGSKAEKRQLAHVVSESIKTFERESKFNFVITKICTIRGRVPRTGRMRNDKRISLWPCEMIVLTSDKRYEDCSTQEVCYISNFNRLIALLELGQIIKIGKNVLKVIKIAMCCYVTCIVIDGQTIESYEAVTVPFEDPSIESTVEEIEDCSFALQHDFDLIIVPAVDRPERYHTLRKLIKDRDIKIIAEIARNVECFVIDRIIQHFHGIFLKNASNTTMMKYISSRTREMQKLLIARFSEEACFNGGLCVGELVDSLMLTSTNVEEASARLAICFRSIEKYQQALKVRDCEFVVDDKCCDNRSISKSNSVKELEDLASSHTRNHLIILTTCPTMAKRLQMWKKTTAMVYVDCENKLEKDQATEVQKIAMMFVREMKLSQ